MADEILNRIEKHMEGTSLGLAALAEVLQKMDGRMDAEDEYAIAKAEQENAALQHASLVKNIAKSVLIELADQGMDVDGEKVKTVGGGDPTKGATATPNYVGESDDTSETITPSTKIEDQQASIQAEDDDDDEDEEKAYMGKLKKAEHDENGDEEDRFPKDEEEEKAMNGDDDDEDDDDVEKLQKQLVSLQKQIASLDISKAVKEESETRLRKMGFKEENGLQRPQLTNVFGADETPIKKAQTVDDVVDQLTNLSYKELRKMQEFKRRGMTEGLPDEIANLS
jgi:hypothetical protein